MATSAKKTDTTKPETPTLSAAMIAGNPAARLWLEIMAESTRFVSERLRNDLDTQKAMLRCRNPVDLVQLQSAFFRNAMEQYAVEAQRMFEVMTKTTQEAVKDTTTSTKRGYDDVPL